MGVSIQLADGQSVIAYENASGVWFETADEASGAIGAPVLSGAVNASWIGLKTNDGGGFAVGWAADGALYQADYNANGSLNTGPRPISSWNAPPAALAFTSAESSLPGQLLNGDMVTATPTNSLDGHAFNLQLEDANGAPIGQPYVQPLQHLSSDAPVAVTSLATGGYALFWAHGGALLPSALRFVTLFDSQGAQVGSTVAIPGLGGFPSHPIAGLPDGGFVTLGTDFSSGVLSVTEYAADGSAAAPPVALGQPGSATPGITVFADGRYEVSWGGQHQMFTEANPSLLATDPSPPAATAHGGSGGDTVFVQVAPPITLAGSNGWTSAAVLSNGNLAVVASQEGAYGGHVGVEQTYDAGGALLLSTPLRDFVGPGATLDPHVVALDGGYSLVSYGGNTDYEIYNAAGDPAFVHNMFTSPTARFTALPDGGNVQTDSRSSVFGVYDAATHALAWQSYVPGSPGDPTIHALPDGSFVFTYAGSREIETYDASGHLLHATGWGAPVQNFAMGLAPVGDSGFLGAWIGEDFTPGPNSGQTAILIEPFLNDGGTIARAITLSPDLDPWHTQFALQSHRDGSVAVLWSQGGASFGAEYGPGGDLSVHSTGVAEAVSDMRVIQLANDTVGLAWLQFGDAWAEIFNPATGAVQRVDLGAATGDLSTVHALATAAGGIAVSWHTGDGVRGAILSASGQAGLATTVPGDLIGVDHAGNALVLGQTSGSAQLYHYHSDAGLFWV